MICARDVSYKRNPSSTTIDHSDLPGGCLVCVAGKPSSIQHSRMAAIIDEVHGTGEYCICSCRLAAFDRSAHEPLHGEYLAIAEWMCPTCG